MTNLVHLANESLPLMPGWSEFSALFEANLDADGRFLHAIERDVDQVPSGLTRGINLFGPSSIPIMESKNGRNKMRRIESFLLANATVMPQSMTILDSKQRLVQSAMENITDPRAIARYDLYFRLNDAGEVALSDSFFTNCKNISSIALPICGPGFYNYGHFLYDGLAGALMHHQLLGDRANFVGPPLRKWQEEILDVLGIRKYYLPIEAPTRFCKVLGTTMLSMHVSYPSRFARLVFDQIRFYLGATERTTKTKVFLSRRTDTSKRVLINRAEVEELMARLGFEVVCPDLLSFREQVTLMASARFVVGEAGAGLANVGFCDPGASILEILTMPDAWTRGACFLMSHSWHGFFPELTPNSPVGVDLSYLIDCNELAATISIITSN